MDCQAIEVCWPKLPASALRPGECGQVLALRSPLFDQNTPAIEEFSTLKLAVVALPDSSGRKLNLSEGSKHTPMAGEHLSELCLTID